MARKLSKTHGQKIQAFFRTQKQLAEKAIQGYNRLYDKK